MKYGIKDRIIEYSIVLVFLAFSFVILYPLWNTAVYSFNDSADALKGGLYWLPRKFTFRNYELVFSDKSVVFAYGVSIARTVIGTALSILIMSMFAYSLIHKELKLRKVYTMMGIFTMYFSGGLIPTFLLIKNLKLLDTFPVLILPYLLAFYYVILLMSFFKGIPESIEESARIDGANELYIYFRIILPMSAPVIATIVLFSGVFFWNEYFSGVIYITRNKFLYPIQTYLFKIISEADTTRKMSQAAVSAAALNPVNEISPRAFRIAAMFAVSFPVVVVYPFVQRYLIKGMLIGSIKG